METFTLKVFNTGQVTLPKTWRDKVATKHFLAEETEEGLLIKPLKKEEVVYFENKDGFGLYCEKGLPVEKILTKIKALHGPDRKILKKAR
ncbi:AbrB/MazE/SpoVT family DNA-binding domain-containing protein [Candidatus Microgenomates bacterium]|nr:AbrB/MazE/SpoVT family DNA-binding domain-containing protein [Candidatus Microgenomates bacterium]